MDDKTKKQFEEELDKFIKNSKKKGVTAYQDVIDMFSKFFYFIFKVFYFIF